MSVTPFSIIPHYCCSYPLSGSTSRLISMSKPSICGADEQDLYLENTSNHISVVQICKTLLLNKNIFSVSILKYVSL